MRYLILIIVILSISCASNKKKNIEKQGEVKIEKTEETIKYAINFIKADLLSEVLAEAEKEKKWVYIDLGAKWCLPCNIMKRDVYTNKETVKIMNDNFITYMVDVEKGEGPDLKLIFEIASYPTLLFIDSKGKVKLRKESALTGSGLIAFAQEALKMQTGN